MPLGRLFIYAVAVAVATLGAAPGTAGARGGPATGTVQQRAERIAPAPSRAADDRGRAFRDGCHLKKTRRTRSPRCTYGHAGSRTTVVNLGDSHGLHFFPTLRRVARGERWRLVNLTRAGCSVADVRFRRACDAWRGNSLARIRRLRPDVVVVHHGTAYPYRVKAGGRRLSRAASRPHLRAGLERTLRRLKRTGARVVLVRDMPKAPRGVVRCVGRNRAALGRCAFAPRRPKAAAFDVRAARGVKRVRIVDPKRALCRRGRCPAVIGDVLVYRNDYHLTATYARTLAPWLAHRLRRALGR